MLTYFYVRTFTNNYLFKAKQTLLANPLTPDIEMNLTACCLRCWSTGLTEREIPMKYFTNTTQVPRGTLTNTQRVKSAMIALTDGTAFLRFYQMISG